MPQPLLDMVGIDVETLEARLVSALRADRFRPSVLRQTAQQYGTRALVDLIERERQRARASR